MYKYFSWLFHEHSKKEYQNLSFLLRLAGAVTKVDWESLPTVREVSSHDTEDPEDQQKKKPTDLPEYKLLKILDDVDDIIYDEVGLFASNFSFFKPEKKCYILIILI